MWGILFVQIAGMTGSYSTFFPTKIMKRRQWKHEDWLEFSMFPAFPLPIFRQEKYGLPPDFVYPLSHVTGLETHTHIHTTTTYQKSRWLGLPSSPPPIAVISLLLKRVTGLVG